ncbi:hypothetical protein NOC27_2574 [Nitrosococcus oceani AFC27]|nr:hypothetical protein NOC27_2574 [Nitrosococcus oceani AFC27]
MCLLITINDKDSCFKIMLASRVIVSAWETLIHPIHKNLLVNTKKLL